MTELCNEWRSELLLGLIDFEEGFDTVEHDVQWEVLKDQGLHLDYIDIIKRLYDGQTASVQAGAASRRFPLLRGVKQGDPVSALLFIAVMEQCFPSLKNREHTLQFTLRRRHSSVCKFKPRFDENDFHLRDEAVQHGLRMHLGKTKILSNVPPDEPPESLKVGFTSSEGGSSRKISGKEADS